MLITDVAHDDKRCFLMSDGACFLRESVRCRRGEEKFRPTKGVLRGWGFSVLIPPSVLRACTSLCTFLSLVFSCFCGRDTYVLGDGTTFEVGAATTVVACTSIMQ